MASLSLGLHSQSNDETERLNQELETKLWCLVSQNPSSWAEQLLLVEYAHNILSRSATHLSPFQCADGYQPPLFLSREREAACPSALTFIRLCRQTWTKSSGSCTTTSSAHSIYQWTSSLLRQASGCSIWCAGRDMAWRKDHGFRHGSSCAQTSSWTSNDGILRWRPRLLLVQESTPSFLPLLPKGRTTWVCHHRGRQPPPSSPQLIRQK